MKRIIRELLQAAFSGRHTLLFVTLLSSFQMGVVFFYIAYTNVKINHILEVAKKSIDDESIIADHADHRTHAMVLNPLKPPASAMVLNPLKPPSSAMVLNPLKLPASAMVLNPLKLPASADDAPQLQTLMSGCPKDWPLEVVSRNRNGAPLIQVCRSIRRDGNWKCADGWLTLQTEMRCIPDPAAINHHGNGAAAAAVGRNFVRQPKYAPLSDQRKLLFIHIPKAGGTSVETSFLFDDRRAQLRNNYLGGHNKIKAFDEEFFKSYHKFCMVRHPCSRLISTWGYYSQNLGNRGDIRWAEKFMDEKSKTSFGSFVSGTLYPDGPVHVNNQLHLQNQVDMIFYENGSFALDQLLVFEKWNDSFDALGRQIHTDVSSIKATHKLSSKHRTCREMYTTKTWKKLVELYAMDFCVLGYSTKITEFDVHPPLNMGRRELTKRYATCAAKFKSQTNNLKHIKRFETVIKNDWQKPTQDNDPCNVFTYYEPPRNAVAGKLSSDKATLKAWKEVWSMAGWRPRVLSEDDARKHPEYMSLRGRFENLPTTNVKEYELSCFLRHVAMAAVGGGWMADYDVLPFHIPKCVRPFNSGLYTVYQLYTPSLVSANSTEYTRVATLMANVDWKNKSELFSHNGKFHVSDMHALRTLFESRIIQTMRVVMEAKLVFKSPFTCDRSLGYRATPTGMPELPWAVHFSHSSLGSLGKEGLSAVWPGSSWSSKSFESEGIESKRGEFMTDGIKYLRETCLSDNEN